MTRQIAAIPETLIQYDDCLLSSCLRKLFTGKAKTKNETSTRTGNNIAAFRNELEQLNTAGVTEMTYEYLEAIEKSLPGDFYYTVVYKKNEPMLLASFQSFALTSQSFNLEKDKDFAKRVMRFLLDLKNVHVLISGNALRNNTPCCCFNTSEMSRAEAAELVVSLGEKIAADICASALIIKDMPFSSQQKKWMKKLGFEQPITDSEMVMEVNEQWGSLTDYTNALSRKYKTRAKKILDAGSALEMRNLTLNEIKRYQHRITELFEQVSDSQSFTLARPGREHFGKMKEIYGDNFEVICFLVEGVPAAFYSAFITDDAYEIYYAGFDYPLNAAYQLYFNILFSGLERAITLRKKTLRLGRTSFDAKASLGAQPQELGYYFKAGNIPGVVSAWFANYFSSMEAGKWKLRHPLRF